MSALQIKSARRARISTSMRCSIPGCGRSPQKVAEIAGYPVGRLCTRHAGEWRLAWDAALCVPVEGAVA